MTKTISIIVAVDANNGIGKDNDLLTFIPGDLKRFKEITTGHPVIMGRKTLESLPKGPLPNRTNIIITGSETKFDGCVTVNSIQEAIDACPEGEESFIIGGGKIYEQFLPIADKLYLTVVEKEFEADTFFPEINFDNWKLESKEAYSPGEKTEFGFSYQNYIRK